MRAVSNGIRSIGASKETAIDLQSLEFVVAVLRCASYNDVTTKEGKREALNYIFNELFHCEELIDEE